MDSSLNLNTLASTLPSPYQNAEKDLLNNFKAAALSITTLYRSSRHASKRAYNAGYASACNDLLLMIQQGVSAEGIEHTHSHDSPGASSPIPTLPGQGHGMTIGKVMDWIEARMEAIKSREEEEDEEEERDGVKERGSTGNVNSTSSTTAPAKAATVSKAPSYANSHRPTREQGPNPSNGLASQSQPPSQAASPSPPPATLRQTQRAHTKQTLSKCILPANLEMPSVERFSLPNSSASNLVSSVEQPSISSPALTISAVSSLSPFSENVSAVAAGAKRRHAVMMMLDPSSTSSSPPSVGSSTSTPGSSPALVHGHVHNATSRRRTRSTRNSHQNQNLGLNLNIGLASEAMDIEEDGRERKRVTRR
ncbi:hypothetical protein BDP27DRAFT_1413823 [Rhodocollybia butyracea]|uniref:Uncharacterized protein n=1 Tax=Rhodocollybia butyracea TaxID=206335 RepID=A0A9P5Q9C5_9AGAR|nr:hypothetical protein BDP27DRAFT_1413823 [Rhodocollybia butyracea]